MTGAIVFTWGATVRGREAKALEVFAGTLGYFESLGKEGRIHGHREYFSLSGDVGELAGMMIIDGDIEQLQAIVREEEYRHHVLRAGQIVEHFTIRLCAGGTDQAVQERVAEFAAVGQDLGLM